MRWRRTVVGPVRPINSGVRQIFVRVRFHSTGFAFFPGNMVVDTRYYDTLQIKTDADELTIKKVLLSRLYCISLLTIFVSRHTDARLFWYGLPCALLTR
jgi:hypothetical protein